MTKPYMDINDQSIPLFSNPFVLTIFGKRSYHLMIVDHDIAYTGKHPWGKNFMATCGKIFTVAFLQTYTKPLLMPTMPHPK